MVRRKNRRAVVYGSRAAERRKAHRFRRRTIKELAEVKEELGEFKKAQIPTQKKLDARVAKRMASRIKGPRPKERVKPVGKREIMIVSRKGQPSPFVAITPLEHKSYLRSVSSSWLSTIGYLFMDKVGTFTTQTGRQYRIIGFPFADFEQWYYAQSKGTYFNEFIKEQYTIRGTL